jgi:hypothetical protein
MMLLLNLLCCMTVTVLVWLPEMDYCWAGNLCSTLRFLHAWAGCCFHSPVLGVAWLMCRTVWLRLALAGIQVR